MAESARDEKLVMVLSKADHKTLERIVDYLDASPVLAVKKKREYRDNKADLTKCADFMAKIILEAGGFGVAGYNIVEARYRPIVNDVCRAAKLPVTDLFTVEELEKRLLQWAFAEAQKINPRLATWNGKSDPDKELIEYTRDNIILGYTKPDFVATVRSSFKEANDLLKGYASLLLKYLAPLVGFLNNPAVKNFLPVWMLGGLVTTAETIQAAFGAGATAAAGAGAAATAAVAAAYAGLLVVYAGLALAGPAVAVLFPTVFEIAILRLKDA